MHVATSQFSAFERAFSTRDLFHGKSSWALWWLSCASGALVLLLLDLYLTADLLRHRGELVVQPGEVEELAKLVPEALGSTPDQPQVGIIREIEDSGLLPTVWHSRNEFWGHLLVRLFRAFPMLHSNSSALMWLVLAAFLIGFARSLMLALARTQCTAAALDVTTRLRRMLHRQTLRLGPGDLADTSESHVMGLFTDETDHLRDGLQSWIFSLGRYPLELLLLVLLALLIEWRVALMCLIALGFFWWLIRRERRRFESATKLDEDRADAQLRLLAESLHKTRIVRAYAMEEFEHDQFQNHLENFRERLATVKHRERWSLWASWVMAMACTAIVVFWVGLKVLQPSGATGGLTLPSALLMLITLAFIPPALEALWELRRTRSRASRAADRIFRYLNQVPTVGQAVGAKFLEPLSKSLRLEAVTFTLPNRQKKFLDGVDFSIPAGEIVAVVSFDPMEARALAYLLPRFIEPQSGRVLIDGEDIAWVTLESLRAEAVYVGGTDPLFTGSVLENVRCGNTDYSLQDVTEATKRTHAHSFILKLPQGYETILGEHGEQLDVGQTFRLGLARAVLRDPALLIIEEPAMALDEDTKSLVDDAYNRTLRGRTVVFLPTRLSTLRRADRIIFLHRGKVEASGKHADLVKNSPLYRHWEYSRFNEFRRETE